jgi:HPt (histidine-containing phosphotransfer) domain-containing protein
MRESCLLAVPDLEQKPPIIDADHLQRMTLGDRSLEREVLQIFVRQTTLMLQRIVGAKPACAAAAAHTLKGSARGIGAWGVGQAAEQLEEAASRGDARGLEAAIAELEAACAEARAAIAARLDDPMLDPMHDSVDAQADAFGDALHEH